MILPRGNQTQAWWICKVCLSRCERLPLSAVTSTDQEPQPQDLITFGKHMGDTYQEVYEQDRSYCQWVMSTMETGDPSEPMRRFAAYIYKKEVEQTYEADQYTHVPVDSDMDF